MKKEKIKKELIKLLKDKDFVEFAFGEECRNTLLAGAIDGSLRGAKRERANELLKELGPDEFEMEYEKKVGKKVDTVKAARRFWAAH